MNLDEWKAVLTAIKNDKLLMSLKITNVFDSDSSANPNVPSAGTNFRAPVFLMTKKRLSYSVEHMELTLGTITERVDTRQIPLPSRKHCIM